MAKKSKRSSSPVGVPLCPVVLEQLGGLRALARTAETFRPDGPWTHRYRIWTCYGRRSRGNGNVGWLRIQRTPGDPVAVAIEQRIRNAGGVVSSVQARVECRADALASPIAWTVESRFTDTQGAPAPALTTSEKARVSGASIEASAGTHTPTRQGSKNLAADWCLFDAVQRLPFQKNTSIAFDVLEGLGILKKGQRLSYAGLAPEKEQAGGPRLHLFQQVGHGAWPYEYYVDGRHRLQIVVTGPRAYVLDDAAERVVAAASKGGRK